MLLICNDEYDKVFLQKRIVQMRDYLKKYYPFSREIEIRGLEDDLERISRPSCSLTDLKEAEAFVADLERKYPGADDTADKIFRLLSGVLVASAMITFFRVALNPGLFWNQEPAEPVFVLPVIAVSKDGAEALTTAIEAVAG